MAVKSIAVCGRHCTLVVDSEEKLCKLMTDFGKVCERRKLNVNVCKCNVLRCSRSGDADESVSA